VKSDRTKHSSSAERKEETPNATKSISSFSAEKVGGTLPEEKGIAQVEQPQPKQREDSKSEQITEKIVLSKASVERKVSTLASNPPCSTIVLYNGTTIEARNIKVTHRDVFFQTCDKEKRLSVPRKEVVRILATTDTELLNSGVSESRFKDRHTNGFAILMFVLSFLVVVGTSALLYYQLWLFAGLVAVGFVVACLFFLFFVNHDLSSLKGIGLLVTALILGILNVVMQSLLIGEYL
jgi:heme/copper-type cytochrome/quinol oxidase subunit 4